MATTTFVDGTTTIVADWLNDVDTVTYKFITVTATVSEINTLDGITSTTAELNTLTGITSTTAELNTLTGITSTTAELNILDGVTATTSELNTMAGVTASTPEINLLDFDAISGGAYTGADADTLIIGDDSSSVMRHVSFLQFLNYVAGNAPGVDFIDKTYSAAVFKGLTTHANQTGETANAGGGQLNAKWVTNDIAEFSTVATAGDSVKLPSAVAGYKITVINNGANALDLFPWSGDNLGAGVDTAVSIASGANATYVSYDATNWVAI